MLFSLPRKRGINIAKIRGNKVTDYTRISVGALVVLSVGLCQSRKGPYLPLEPQCVRLLPRPTGLPPMAFVAGFRLCSRRRENRPQTP